MSKFTAATEKTKERMEARRQGKLTDNDKFALQDITASINIAKAREHYLETVQELEGFIESLCKRSYNLGWNACWEDEQGGY